MCIHKLCCGLISEQPLSKVFEWEMTWPNHVPVLSAGNLRHVDHFTSFLNILLDFLTCPHPAPSPWFPRHTISNFKYLHHLHQVCAESYAVGHMDECSMIVVIQTDLCWALTALSITRMTSLTWSLVAYFVPQIAFALSLNSNRQTEIEHIGRLTAWVGL